MVPPARKRWNPIQRTSVAKTEVSPQPECVLIKSRGKGERLSIPRELFATFRFFKRPSNRGGGIGKGKRKKKRKKRREERLMDAYERRMLPENSGARSPTGFPLSGIQRRGGFERPYLAMRPFHPPFLYSTTMPPDLLEKRERLPSSCNGNAGKAEKRGIGACLWSASLPITIPNDAPLSNNLPTYRKKRKKKEFKLDVYIDTHWHRQNINYYTFVRL